MDEDYDDSNEEEIIKEGQETGDDDSEERNVKFEPLTHKPEKVEELDEDEVDNARQVTKQYFIHTNLRSIDISHSFYPGCMHDR